MVVLAWVRFRFVVVLLTCGLISAVSATVAGVSSAKAAEPTTLGSESSSVLASNADASPDVLAGSHPFALTAAFEVNTTTDSEGHLISVGGDLKDLVAELPPGLTIDPLASTLCGAPEFASVNQTTGEDGCPNASAVGVVAVENVAASTLAERKVSDYPIYDLVAPAGTPAQFGFNVAGVAVYLSATVRTGGDYGLTVTMADIPQAIHVLGSAVTFWGVPAEGAHDKERGDCIQSHGTCPAGIPPKPFLTLPGQCTTPPSTTLRADSWQQAGQFTALASDPLIASGPALTSCDTLDFSPSFHALPESATADTPTGLKLDVQLPQSEDPSRPGEAELKDAVVVLPPGMRLNLSRANDLVGCPLEGSEGIDLSSSEPGHCPETSRIGSVSVTTPLLAEALHGGVYVAQQGNLPGNGTNPFGSLLALYILAEGSGVVLKLPAEVLANPETGQLTMHVGPDPISGQPGVPQLPLANLEVAFDGSPQAALVTPATCGSYTTTATLEPWSGVAPVTLTDESQITAGCASPFDPAFSASTSDKQANGYSPIAITVAREDGEGELKSVSTTLPPGLLATLGSVVLCPEPQASLGTCGAGSLIGKATSSVGAGPQPFAITGGQVYLTAAYGGGSFGLSLVMPAVAGPFNLGPAGRPLVIRAAIHINPLTGQATIDTDATGPHSIPSILQGIVPQIRTVDVDIDRPRFIFNPSNCSPQPITGVIASTQGATANVSAPFAATNCGALPFSPKLTASTVGRPSRVNGIGLDVKIVAGVAGEANARSARVELPKQLPSRLTTLQKACLAKVFDANPASCPPGSVVGTADAVTTILPVPLVGPAYFVSYGGAKFPELVLVLQGYGVTIDLHGETFISHQGITSTTFPQIPDAPAPSFELHLPAGKDSALTTDGNICASALRLPIVIVAQNGAVVRESPRIAVSGCRPTLKIVHHSVRGRVARIAVRVPSAGRLVVSGKGLSRVSRKLGKAGTVTVRLTLSKRERRFLAHHRGRRLKIAVEVLFVPSHGSRLSAHVTVHLRWSAPPKTHHPAGANRVGPAAPPELPSRYPRAENRAGVAQLVERLSCKQGVRGSSPLSGSWEIPCKTRRCRTDRAKPGPPMGPKEAFWKPQRR